MIVIYPMMVSNAVSENTLPAIGKMLEHYIMVYMQNDVINTLNDKASQASNVKIRYKIKGKKWIGESVDLSEAKPTRDEEYEKGNKKRIEDVRQKARDAGQKTSDVLHPGQKKRRDERDEEERDIKYKNMSPKEREEALEDEEKKEREAGKYKSGQEKNQREKEKWELEKAKGEKVSIKVSDKSISIEPTYMSVETDKLGTQFIGVKVIPYRVISDAKLSHLIMHDMKVKGIASLTIPFGRQIIGAMLRLTNRGPVSGDPKKDIIYRTTGHKGETFVVLEKNQDIDETFLRNTSRINRLFKMGWGNFVLADDVLGLAYFCLRANKGICQGVSYRMMYKTLGQSGVYEDMEDLRKQNSSLFKVGAKKFSKLLGEAKSDEKLFNYQERQ
jgi:hypothetical protein